MNCVITSQLRFVRTTIMSMTLANGAKLPSIGFGTSTGVPNEEELSKALDTAIETGYRHIDTAFTYRNEQIVGKVLQKWFKSGKLKREEIFITTKLPFGVAYPEAVENYMQVSLSNLQLDYVDLYLVHFPVGYKREEGSPEPVKDENGLVVMGPKTDHRAVWEKMEQLVDSGRTRYIGLSNYSISQIETVLRSARIKPASLQIEVHIYLQQREIVDFCQKNNITVVAFSPLGSPGYNERMKKLLSNYEDRQLPNLFGNSTVNEIGEKYSKSAAQVMLRFLIQNGVVPIPKSTNPRRIKENLELFDFELDGNDVVTLRGLEVGEEARVSDFRSILKGIEAHPDYPFPKL